MAIQNSCLLTFEMQTDLISYQLVGLCLYLPQALAYISFFCISDTMYDF